MMTWLHTTALMAQSEWIHRFRLRSNASSSSVLLALGLLAAVVVLVWLAARWFQMHEAHRAHCPRALFRELSRAHGLSSAERNVLLRLAHQQNPYNPAAIFIEPQRFAADQLGPHLEGEAATVQQLRDKLFGSLAKPHDTLRS